MQHVSEVILKIGIDAVSEAICCLPPAAYDPGNDGFANNRCFGRIAATERAKAALPERLALTRG
jgi:hypothetical protein